MEIGHIKEQIASYAVEAMLYEVAATPKPGLVDRVNNGAHYDMDYFTFMSSAAALHDSFDRMINQGIAYCGQDIRSLLPKLREIGKESEQTMFHFTKGINTHKGIIFSLGILCGCAGWLLGNKKMLSSESVCGCAAEMCEGICAHDFAMCRDEAEMTKGERMYRQYGCKGVRGVAESGYKVVRTTALVVYTQLRDSRVLSVNDALVHTLLYLIENTQDTNIVARHNEETAIYARQWARTALDRGGMLSEKGRQSVKQMDQEFIDRYISPGGCADLLAVTHFLYRINKAVQDTNG